MNSLVLATITFIGFIIAYKTYGKFLGSKIFRLNPDHVCPSESHRDDHDFVPTKSEVLFGHHFTSISGLGPIVGPVIAVIWGWIPAVLWVFFGSIFMGAVHDFGSLIISLRGQGRSIGDLANNLINSRVRTLFLAIIFFATLIVIAIFTLIIAILFNMYPQAVLPVWLEIPLAMVLGYLIYQKKKNPLKLGIIAVLLMYIAVIAGAYFPVKLPSVLGFSPTIIWMLILFAYTYIASVLPVQKLLQPRDYINSHQLLIAMGLLVLGVVIAHPPIVAPALDLAPQGAPPIWPFLFVVIACGAISGFHSLISSGTTSKQCANEKDSLFIGYGSMLLEGSLSILAIIAVVAGIGMGFASKTGEIFTGAAAFTNHYSSWAAASGLAAKLSAFIMGSANLIGSLGIPSQIAITIMGVFLVSFAATTLDSAARIQRYVVSELAKAHNLKFAIGRHPAAILAIGTAMWLAFANGDGKGALTLWPLFGAVNQLLAGLALLVITIYLARKKLPIGITLIPMLFMVVMTGWALTYNLISFYGQSNWLLFTIGLIIFILEIWMIVESVIILQRNYFTKQLEPLESII